MCTRIGCLVDPNCNVQALLSTEDVAVIKMVFFHGLDYVNTLFATDYANPVARIDYHDYQK